MARVETVQTIINRTAVEVGLSESPDPVGGTNETFIQLRGLLTSAGQELCDLNAWPELLRRYSVTKDKLSNVPGSYFLPDDFNYMVDQTGWDLTNNMPVAGPLSPQQWSFLKGTGTNQKTIYASFRQADGKIDLTPNPLPEGEEISFAYISRDWLLEETGSDIRLDSINANQNVCLFDPLLIIKFLKLKFLQAKGFDSAAAGMEFDTLLGSRIGKSTGAPILRAGGDYSGIRYITPYGNTRDSGYGL